MNRLLRSRGFTLIEIMVTLALLSVLMLVAVPSFIGFKRNAELTAAANNLVAILSSARGEAMKRSIPTLVVPTDGSNWANGWTAFVDTNFNGTYDSGTDIVVATKDDALPSYITMTAKTGAKNAGVSSLTVKYNGSGYNMSGAAGAGFVDSTFEIKNTLATGSDALAQTRRIKVNATGRPRVCTPTSVTDTTTCADAGD